MLRKSFYKIFILNFILCLAQNTNVFAQQNSGITSNIISSDNNGFPIVAEKGNVANLFYDPSENIAVIRAAKDLQSDIQKVTGKSPNLSTTEKVTKEDPKGMATHSVWLFSADKVTGPYKLVNGPLTPQYNNDSTLFEDEDGQVYLYCSGNGLFQAKIDLKTGKLMTPIEKFLDKKQYGWPEWMVGGIEGPFVIKKEGTYFMFFSTWTRGYEIGLLKSKSPLGPWELASPEPIFGTRKKGYRTEIAKENGYENLFYTDTEDPYQETGHNALFIGPDGNLWNSCHYFMYEKYLIRTVRLFSLGN